MSVSFQVEKDKPILRVSVTDLVKGLPRSGDLRRSVPNTTSALEGLRAHRALQASREGDYTGEVPFSHRVELEACILEIKGRIDGILRSGDGLVLEEIKTTRRDLKAFQEADHPAHWGQLKLYAYAYAEREGLEEIPARLVYYHLDTQENRAFHHCFAKAELEDFFRRTIDRFLEEVQAQSEWRFVRDRSIRELPFPYPTYRNGQREMAVEVFRTIREEGQLILQAATGIGKTMGTLFPAFKAMADGDWTRIFYLTARTTGRRAAERALEDLRDRGLRLRSVTLTARDKICFAPGALCAPEECAYARGYYDRVEEALAVRDRLDAFPRDAVEQIAREFQVCPFELSLDLSLYADLILCDYNYAFDPRVTLRRIFVEERGRYVFLVDEAHNLPDRARAMFSAEILKQDILRVRKLVKGHLPALYKGLGNVNTWMLEAGRRTEASGHHAVKKEAPREILPLLQAVAGTMERWLTQAPPSPYPEGLLDLFFTIRAFLGVLESYDETYVTLYEKAGRNVRLKLFCKDPSENLRKALKSCGAAVFFSATLTPPGYFRDLLGCGPGVKALALGSPFQGDHLCLLVADGIRTTYHHRDGSKGLVAEMIRAMVTRRRGNYLLFFPSYGYMRMVYEVFTATVPDMETIFQRPGMTEKERDLFLARFTRDSPRALLGFVVMGGIFGEGIDLEGDRLTGAVIVGVGLPALSRENELIRSHFDGIGLNGFDYAYRYPGFTRVLQAAGRVLRTESDRGVVLLIDRRFAEKRYRELFPREWRPMSLQRPRDVDPILSRFWRV